MRFSALTCVYVRDCPGFYVGRFGEFGLFFGTKRHTYSAMETTKPYRLVLCIPPRLMADVERAASEHETSLSEYVRTALRARLAAERLREREADKS